MGFSKKVKEEIFVKCARHCCVCHKGTGLNIEVHHIKSLKEGGDNSFENAIGLCFDCHADAGHYFADHPKGSKLSPEELVKHKESWFKIVETHNIQPPSEEVVEILVKEDEFAPVFVREETRYIDKKSMYRVYELTGIDPMESIKERIKENTWNSPYYIPGFDRIKTFDEYLDFISRDDYKLDDETENIDCQPLEYCFNGMRMTKYKELNKSNCVLNLSLKNVSNKPLEDFKLYITMDNIVSIDSVNKQRMFLDTTEYSYNILFDENSKGEFIPSQKVLVQNDSISIDTICFRTKHFTTEVVMNWEFFSRDVNVTGQIFLKIDPKLEEDKRTKYVDKDDVREPIIRILPKIDFS